MIPKKFIKDISTPMIHNNDAESGVDNFALILNGDDEYLKLYPQTNNDGTNSFQDNLNTDSTWEASTSGNGWAFSIWIKKTALRNTAQLQQTVWHNGSAGHHTMELYFDDNSNRLKYKIGNGSSTDITVDTGIDVTIDEWTHIHWRKKAKDISLRVNSETSTSSVFGITNSSAEWDKIKACKDAVHANNGYFGCYKEGDSGTAAEFFAGELGELVLLKSTAATNLHADFWYNGGEYLDVDNAIASSIHLSSGNSSKVNLWLRPGHGNWSGLSDGFNDKIIFDMLELHVGPSYVNINNGYVDAYWASNTNGWALDGSSASADREGDGQSAAGVLTHATASKVGNFYGFFFTGTTSSSSGTNTITLGNVTLYSANENATINHDGSQSAGCFTATASNTDPLILTAHNTTDWSVDKTYIVRFKRMAEMVNLSASTDFIRSGLKAQGSGGGGSGAQ